MSLRRRTIRWSPGTSSGFASGTSSSPQGHPIVFVPQVAISYTGTHNTKISSEPHSSRGSSAALLDIRALPVSQPALPLSDRRFQGLQRAHHIDDHRSRIAHDGAANLNTDNGSVWRRAGLE